MSGPVYAHCPQCCNVSLVIASGFCDACGVDHNVPPISEDAALPTRFFSKEPHSTQIEIRRWWSGESEDGLWGFDTVEGRDAFERGEPGPFWRRVRPAHLPPPSMEAQVTRAYLDGEDMQQVLDTVRAGGTPQ